MTPPFTTEQFFDTFARYNRLLWPFAIALWLYALSGAIGLARRPHRCGRTIAVLLALQWAWAGVAYHAAFFTRINPAAWLFAVLFVVQSGLFVWVAVSGHRFRFSTERSPRVIAGWVFIVAGLLYPMLATLEGHRFPEAPTFGLPCPTTVLTVGFLFAADRGWPRVLAVIPVLWAFVGGSAAFALGVRTDLLLWVSGIGLLASVLLPGSLSRLRRLAIRRPLLSYYASTFAISWGGVLAVIGGAGGVEEGAATADSRFVYALAAMLAGPSVSGVLLTALVHGRAGLRRLLSRALRWRVNPVWYGAALFAAPLLWGMTLLVLSSGSSRFVPGLLTSSDRISLIVIGLSVAVAAGIFEEIGWTGFAIPEWRKGHGAFSTGLAAGILWGAWHLLTNVFWAAPVTTGELSLSIFLPASALGVLVGYLAGFRVLMVWVHERTQSLLLAMLMHVSLTASVLILDPLRLSGSALLLYSFALAGAVWTAVAVIAAYRSVRGTDRQVQTPTRFAQSPVRR